MYDIINTPKDLVLSFGDQQITGKDCICTEFNINITNNSSTGTVIGTGSLFSIKRQDEVTITLELICTSDNFLHKVFGKEYKPKIRTKKIKDCSIQELLFAIRQKINEVNKK